MDTYKKHLGEIKQHPRHWAYVYQHRRRHLRLISTKPIVFGQIFTIIASLMAGYLLDLNKESIAMLAGAFVMMPGIVDLEASITGALTAKVNHQTMELRAPNWLITAYSVLFAFMVAAFASLIIGIVGGFITAHLFGASAFKMVILCFSACTVVGVISYPLMSMFTLIIQKLNVNPDNIVGPVQSSVVDILAVLAIAVVSKWLV